MNKQIEEIKEILIKTCKRTRSMQEDYMQDRYAEALYNAGYRKQSEGEWIEERREWDFDPYFYDDYTCSVCGSREQNKRNFCPNCGAKMKGDVGE